MAESKLNRETPARDAPFDGRGYRQALGRYATGITIVTALGPSGNPVGLTANSFNSVSLDPPLVLWSLAKNSSNLAAFAHADHFAVNVLAADQLDLSNLFAKPDSVNKFAGLDYQPGLGGVPLLPDCVARFQCRFQFTYEGGDHLIFVGRVLAFDETDRSALIFHRGRYAISEPHPDG